MTCLDREQRRLLAIVALAAANHRLSTEIPHFLPVLPDLIVDRDDCALCRALLLYGMHDVEEARRCLAGVESEAAAMLREALESPGYSTP